MRHNHLLIASLILSSSLISPITTFASTTHHKETAGQYLDGSATTAKIKAAFLADKIIKSLAINVNTYKGEVQLSGFVDNILQRDHAALVASRVVGVTVVQNDLIIKSH